LSNPIDAKIEKQFPQLELSSERSNGYQRVFIFKGFKPSANGMITVNVNPDIKKNDISFLRGGGFYFIDVWVDEKDLIKHINTIIKRWPPKIKEAKDDMRTLLKNPAIPEYFSKEWAGIEKMLAQLDAYHERVMVNQAKANLIAKNFSLVLDKTLSTLKQAYALNFIKAEKNNSQLTFKSSRLLDGFEADEIIDTFASAMSSAFDQHVDTDVINVHNDRIAAYRVIPRRGHTFTIFISPIKAITEQKERSMKLSDLKKIIKETVIKEISSADKAMQVAKLRQRVEKLQQTIAAKKHDKKDSSAEQTQVIALRSQLKKLSDIKPEPVIKQESAVKESVMTGAKDPGPYEIDARTLDSKTTEFLKSVDKMLKAKGFVYEGAQKSSAMIEYKWRTNGSHQLYKNPRSGKEKMIGVGGFVVNIAGWHGQGNYGTGKLILDVSIHNDKDYGIPPLEIKYSLSRTKGRPDVEWKNGNYTYLSKRTADEYIKGLSILLKTIDNKTNDINESIKEDVYENTPEFKSRIMQASMKQQYESELQKKLGNTFYVEYDSDQGALYVGPKDKDDTYIVARLDSKTGDFFIQDFVRNKHVKVKDMNGIAKYVKSIRLTESVIKESKVSDFMLWWTDEIASSEKPKVLKQLGIINYKTFEKLSSNDKDKLIKFYVKNVLKEDAVKPIKETQALVHRISNKMTADKKKKIKTEAVSPTQYYGLTLKKDGHIYDEDGKRLFGNVNFRNINDAEDYLKKHNIQGNISLEETSALVHRISNKMTSDKKKKSSTQIKETPNKIVTATFEIISWDYEKMVPLHGKTLANKMKSKPHQLVVPMLYANKFKKLYPIARNLKCTKWFKDSGDLECIFTATEDEMNEFRAKYENKFPNLPIEDGIEAIRWKFR
jgi:6-pyruvoyl-tetrahydropterin synthase